MVSKEFETVPMGTSILDNQENVLESLHSSLFSVQKTSYGGRGCFASTKIAQGEVVWSCERPLGYAISKDFKKEVCNWCFEYDNGRIMKVRKASKNGKSSINFCSEDCLQAFEAYDSDELLSDILLQLEGFKNQDSNSEEELGTNSNLTKEIIDSRWEETEAWGQNLPQKLTKRQKYLPQAIDEDVYIELRYLATVLLEIHKDSNKELAIFNELQSNEYEKVIKYPHMLQTAIDCFKLAKIIFPEQFQPMITTDFVRTTLGKENGNSFGIWSPAIGEDEYQEYLGFSLYPSASYFNHSCDPTLIKTREKAKIFFKAKRDIEPGEEIFISYGPITEKDYIKRQKTLKEWFFDCCCPRCQDDFTDASKVKL